MIRTLPNSLSAFMCSLFLFLFTLYNESNYAQCAGDDSGVITVCDIANPSSQSINLFSLLGGLPVPGGTWSDDLLSGGLNSTTGILNVQKIRASGVYSYTYTVTGISGCTDNTGTVTVIVGPYAGVPGPDGVVCGDQLIYNLFQLFSGSGGNLSPQSNGDWYNVTSGVAISGSIFSPSAANVFVPTTFEFTYTVPALGTCPASSITAFLTVYPKARPGFSQNLELCSTADLSPYTSLSLFSLLNGEDAGGRWIDNSSTGELTFPSDSVINVQNIYNNFGAGSYSFTYEVMPSNPICTKQSSTVSVIIEKYIDYSNISLQVNPDACVNEISSTVFTAVLTQNPVLVPNGAYNVIYNVNGQSTPSKVVSFVNGVATFDVPNINFTTSGTYTVTVTNLFSTSALGICPNNFVDASDVLVIYPIPDLTDATFSVQDVCQNNAADVLLNNATSLTDGNYTIQYNLTGANVEINQVATFTVSSGVANFVIPGNLLVNAGTTTIVITSITNNATGCSNVVDLFDDFVVKPLPSVPALAVVINDVCEGQSVTAAISGLGTLTSVSLEYDLSGANNSVDNIVTVAVTGGNASFVIPSTLLLNAGATSITITDLTNTGNSCSIVLSNVMDSFTINPLPAAPSSTSQNFCETENATVANLLPNGSQYSWYSSSSSTTSLASTAVLSSGIYYVSQTNASTGCVSPRTAVNVTIEVIPAPILNTNGQNFCGTDNPTIQDLSNNTNVSSSIIWYDAQNGGNQLLSTAILQDGFTYYGYDTNISSGCNSKNSLAVTVSLSNCNVTANFFIPDGFSPNGDGINDTFHIPDIEFVYPNYTIEIFNRYGNLLFEGNKTKDWDGKNSTSKSLMDGIAPNGVYFYVINFNKNNTPAKQGRLYLNR